MKKIKKWLIISIIFLSILTFFAIYFRPIPIVIYSESTVVLVRRFNEETSELESVTDLVDLEQIVEILSHYTTVRSFRNPFPTLVANIQWEIGLRRRSSGPYWIVLGYDNVLYRSANQNVFHRIQNAESLIYEINALFEF